MTIELNNNNNKKLIVLIWYSKILYLQTTLVHTLCVDNSEYGASFTLLFSNLKWWEHTFLRKFLLTFVCVRGQIEERKVCYQNLLCETELKKTNQKRAFNGRNWMIYRKISTFSVFVLGIYIYSWPRTLINNSNNIVSYNSILHSIFNTFFAFCPINCLINLRDW